MIVEDTAASQVLFLVSLFCAWNITAVEINSDLHLLKVKPTKCLCLLPVVSWSWSCYFGLGLGLKNLVLFTLLVIELAVHSVYNTISSTPACTDHFQLLCFLTAILIHICQLLLIGPILKIPETHAQSGFLTSIFLYGHHKTELKPVKVYYKDVTFEFFHNRVECCLTDY